MSTPFGFAIAGANEMLQVVVIAVTGTNSVGYVHECVPVLEKLDDHMRVHKGCSPVAGRPIRRVHNLHVSLEHLQLPTRFLRSNQSDFHPPKWLQEYEDWWQNEGQSISDAVDRAGTPWLRMFDRTGNRVDEILYSPDYRRMLINGYQNGLIWRVVQENTILPAGLGIYLTSFYDPGLACPYTVSLSTLLPLLKYGDAEVQERFASKLLRKDGAVWQGATWMTEIKGGSDLGSTVETFARRSGDHWSLTGDKYFASNAGAEVAVVAARPEGTPSGVRGLALYLVP